MIETSARGEVQVLRLAHGKASALDLELSEALDRALAEFERGSARALVLTGTGSIFSAGVDLFRVLEGGRAYVERFLPVLDHAFATLFFCAKPVVAAVNGHAIAGGFILTEACDRRLLARGKATLGAPELKVGVPFPPVALEVLRRAIPPASLHEVVLAGRTYGDEEALARGFVDELVEPQALLERAVERAEELATAPAAAYALTKRQVRQAAADLLEQHAAQRTREAIEAWSSREVLDAMRSYVERTLKR